jgi:hypothetical protein
MRWRQRKLFPFLFSFRVSVDIRNSTFTSQKHCHSTGKVYAIERLNEVYGETALTAGVIEPLVAAHRDAVVRGKALISPGWYELFALPS